MTVETSERVQKILPLYDGRNLIIGENGWFLESSTGSDELSGDFVVPLEMNDPERGEFTEWILYKDGEVITTVTEDEIDSANDALLGMSGTSLTNPIGADLRSGPGGFVLGALASMVDLFGNDNAGRDSGTAFRFFGNLIPGLRANEKDDTWALWDMQRASKPLATPTTGRAKEGMLDVASAPAADKVLPAGEDAQWVAARREGTMLLREAEATMKQGDCDAAALTCQGAIALFQNEVARGVGLAAEELLARAFADATTASEGNQKQAEARSEAMRLANEAEQWLRNGDLDTALIMAGRAQEALNEVEQFFGRISTEELTRVLEIKVRVQEKQQMRAISAPTTMDRVPSADAATEKRAALEERQRQKLVDKKKEDARKKRGGQATDGQATTAGRDQVKEEDWRQDKDLGATLDRAARQALKDAKYEEAASLARRAVESFNAAGSKGFKRAETEAKGSQNLVDRALASDKVQRAKAAAVEVEQDGQVNLASNLADQNAELEALFAVEAISAELSQPSDDFNPAEAKRKEEDEVVAAAVAAAAVKAEKMEADAKKAQDAAQQQKKKEDAAAANKKKEEEEALVAAAAEAKRNEQEAAAERARVEAEKAEAKARDETERARKEAEKTARLAAEAQREATAALERVKAQQRKMEAQKQQQELEDERIKLQAAEEAARVAVEAAARAKTEEQRIRKQEALEETQAAAEALARMRARKVAKEAELKAKDDAERAVREKARLAAQVRAQEEGELTVRAEEEEQARSQAEAARVEEEAARERDAARRAQEEARDSEMVRARKKADEEKEKVTAAAAKVPPALAPKKIGSGEKIGSAPSNWRGDLLVEPNAGDAAGARRSGSPSLRSMGGTRMVDLSTPDRDPTVRKIVADKFFGSVVGREKKEAIGVKRYEMDVKYHGILLGKKGITVKALEKASGATIRFETSPQGALIIMGTDKQRQVAWKLIVSVQATLPKILSQIREQEIRPGELKTIPTFAAAL